MAAEMFDTLAFSKRLQAGKVPAAQADAHASAQAELVIAYLLRQAATKQDLEQLEARITAALDQMATKADLHGMATKADLDGMAAKSDLEGMATKADLDGMAAKSDLEGMATKGDLDGMVTKADLHGMATKADLDGMATKGDLERMATKADLDGMATKADLHGMATKADLEKMAAAIQKELADLAERTVTEEKLMLLLDLRDKRMTIRLGGMILAAVVAVSTFMRFMQFSGG